jgi:hypothetical protein
LWLNQGWMNVGIDHDTAEFAVESIRRWWCEMGMQLYPSAERLLITADNDKQIAEIDSQFAKVLVENGKQITEIDNKLAQSQSTSSQLLHV